MTTVETTPIPTFPLRGKENYFLLEEKHSLPLRGRCAETWSSDRRNVEQGPACGMRPWSRSRARCSNADPLRVSGVRSPEGPLLRPSTRPGFRGCDRGGAHKHAGNRGAASRGGVASKHKTLGTCSALSGRRVGVVRLLHRHSFCYRFLRNLPHPSMRQIPLVM